MTQPTSVLHLGDCLDVLATMDPNSLDTCISDPPYGLSFMSREWDHGVPGTPFWSAVLRVLKPGATLLAFGGARTYHRLACAIEDAGFEIKDCLQWLYGTGMPKSLNISKAFDKSAGAEREVIGPVVLPRSLPRSLPSGVAMGGAWQKAPNITTPATENAMIWDGWGSGLKPAYEPIIVAMKPLDGTYVANALAHGVAGLNIDGCRIVSGSGSHNDIGKTTKGRWPANVILSHSPDCVEVCAPDCPVGILDEQSGFSQSRVGGSAGCRPLSWSTGRQDGGYVGGTFKKRVPRQGRSDKGGASRFFYTSKASRKERELGLDGWAEQPGGFPMRSTSAASDSTGDDGTKTHRKTTRANIHPTVKPMSIMRYLMRLTATPTGGVVLDPFMGSGTTGMAAALEGRSFVGIEKNPKYLAIARARVQWARNEAGYSTDTLTAAIRARMEIISALPQL